MNTLRCFDVEVRCVESLQADENGMTNAGRLDGTLPKSSIVPTLLCFIGYLDEILDIILRTLIIWKDVALFER